MFFRKQLLLYIIFLTPLSSYAATNYVSILEGGVDFTNASIQDIASVLMIMVISAAALLTALMIIVGGFKYVGSDVVTDKGDGKKMILNALLGLGIILIAVPLLRTINPKLLQLSALPTINYSINDRPRAVTIGETSRLNVRREFDTLCPNNKKIITDPNSGNKEYCCTDRNVEKYYCGGNIEQATSSSSKKTVGDVVIDLTTVYDLSAFTALAEQLDKIPGVMIFVGDITSSRTTGNLKFFQDSCTELAKKENIETEIIFIQTFRAGGNSLNKQHYSERAVCIPKS